MKESKHQESHSTPLPEELEELGHEDDAVIGRALKWSAFVVLFLAVSGCVTFILLNPKEQESDPVETKVEAPKQREIPAEEFVPHVKFIDITAAAGISFEHNNGATGDKLLPESMGSGVAFFDFDDDGDQDLLFTNGVWWPWDVKKRPELKPTTAALYRNNGKGQFEDVTDGSGLDVAFYGMGVAIGDFDNNGLPDFKIVAIKNGSSPADSTFAFIFFPS